MKKIKWMLLITVGLALAGSSYAQQPVKSENIKNMDNIKTAHDSTKPVSAKLIFTGSENSTRALQIKKDGLLAEHVSATEALLICISGEVFYEDEKKNRFTLKQGDYLFIVPNVKHWVKGLQDSQLLLIK